MKKFFERLKEKIKSKPMVEPAILPTLDSSPVKASIPEHDRLKLAVESVQLLRQSLYSAFWWTYVQQDVKFRLESVLDQILVLGPLFNEAFMGGFRLEHARRFIKGESIPTEIPGALFGPAMSEEVYQCGIKPVRFVLDLEEWVEPNDADVQACMTICAKIDELQKKGVLPDVKDSTWNSVKVSLVKK